MTTQVFVILCLPLYLQQVTSVPHKHSNRLLSFYLGRRFRSTLLWSLCCLYVFTHSEPLTMLLTKIIWAFAFISPPSVCLIQWRHHYSLTLTSHCKWLLSNTRSKLPGYSLETLLYCLCLWTHCLIKIVTKHANSICFYKVTAFFLIWATQNKSLLLTYLTVSVVFKI